MAYLDLFQEDPNKNKRALVTFILCVAFLVFAYTCSGQICTQKYNTKQGVITRKAPCEGMIYYGDKLFISIYGDSLSRSSYDFKLYAVLKDSLKDDVALYVQFENGEGELFYPCVLDKESGYTEFKIYPEQLKSIYYGKRIKMEFVNNKLIYKTEWGVNFFSSFISSL